jgi:hypothetical protein
MRARLSLSLKATDDNFRMSLFPKIVSPAVNNAGSVVSSPQNSFLKTKCTSHTIGFTGAETITPPSWPSR